MLFAPHVLFHYLVCVRGYHWELAAHSGDILYSLSIRS